MNTLLSLILTVACLAPSPTNDTVDQLLASISGADASGAEAAVKKFLAQGDEAFAALVADVVDHTSLAEDDAGKAAISRDAKARSAIGGLVHFSARPAGESDRKILAPLVTREAMRETHSVNVRRFFLSQVVFVGGDDECEKIAMALVRPGELQEDVARALQAIGSKRAGELLLEAHDFALPSTGRAILQALVALRYEGAKNMFRRYAKGPTREDRGIAFTGLGRIGDLDSVDLLFTAAARESRVHEKSLATAALLEIAELHSESSARQMAMVYDRLWQLHPKTTDRHVRIAALQGMAKIRGANAMAVLSAAIASADPQIRAAATNIGATMTAQGITAAWSRELKTAAVEAQPAILRLLSRRGDASAAPSVLAALDSEHPEVLSAAIHALVNLSGGEAVAPLMTHLGGSDNGARKHAIDALTRSREASVSAALAESFSAGTPVARRAILDVFAARRAADQVDTVFTAASDKDVNVRRTALGVLGVLVRAENLTRFVKLVSGLTARDLEVGCRALSSACVRLRGPERAVAVIGGLATAPEVARVGLLGVLVSVGDKASLTAVRKARGDADADIRDGAVRALANWPNAEAIKDLVEVAKNPEQEVHGVLALRGCVRLLEASSLPKRQQVTTLKQLLQVTDRFDEKRLLLTGLSRVRSVDSLLVAANYLNDDKLRRETEFAIVQIACPRNKRDKGLRAPEVASTLSRLIEASDNEKLKTQARNHLDSLADGEGFISLFNGRDFDGWQGAVNGYKVEKGAIVCRKGKGHGGNLFTASEYGNFVLRFEFQLAAGTNNGLGLRTPLKGDAAYVGMECQILDNTADKFKNLKPYQFHGSIYGVAAAKRGHLAPLGSWNSQEVICDGRHITVKLNGTVIVDADLDEVSKNGTIDGRKHPGLARERGYIGYLGHGDWVAFRNIRIKVLD